MKPAAPDRRPDQIIVVVCLGNAYQVIMHMLNFMKKLINIRNKRQQIIQHGKRDLSKKSNQIRSPE